MRNHARLLLTLAASAGAAAPTAAWNPPTGDWLKSDAADLRVMTWNIQDGVCSTAVKTNAFNSWNALVRIVAAMKPDVIIMQECGDNSGNGTGGGVDSAATMAAVFGLFVNGGADPYVGGTVGSYIKLFDPALDYPHIFVSTTDDGFNRNVIISRYPFADLNNDVGLQTKYSNIVITSADAYAPGGNGGIRGYQFAEIDLPDAVYTGDLVLGNGHLKANEGGCDDESQRETAARNIAYWIDYFYNGAGGTDPDPNNKIPFDTASTTILDAGTPVIWGGDFNQRWDVVSCAQIKSIAPWMTQAQNAAGADGTDRDRTDSEWDTASHPLTGDTTTQSSSKLDFICWQDSIATARRQFIFRTDSGWPSGTPFPPPVNTFPPVPQSTSGVASDHRCVLVDFIVPLVPPPPTCPTDFNDDGVTDTADLGILIDGFGGPGPEGDANGDLVVDTADLGLVIDGFGPCPD